MALIPASAGRAGVMAILPARMESTRLPGKPLLAIAGRPLILHVAAACRSAGLERVFVATDSSEIARVVEAGGFSAVLTGPASSGTERVHLAWELLGSPRVLVLNVQGDEPMVSATWVDAVLSRPPSEASVTTLARRIGRDEALDPNRVKVVLDAAGRALYFSRCPIPHGGDFHWEHVGLYCFSPESLRRASSLSPGVLSRSERLEQLGWMEDGMSIEVVTGSFEGTGVDTPGDLEAMRKLLER
ncbi:3-deoxy-manno-octulosonate cytidylyltransferase [Candidatus Fermentibacterales bacterium]|nr:3-deoxy-manno-octulosonate cytidylyltransferase [Candidatus Fermentibacterales bacterium]